MKTTLAICTSAAVVLTALAGRPAADGEPTKLLRMPTVSATQIAFAYANNIWTVENWPKDMIAGHDAQLERAVQEAMRMLKEKPVDRLMKEPPPPTHGKQRSGATSSGGA